MTALDGFLGRGYGAQVQGLEAMSTVRSAFQAAVADDPTLIAQAQAKLAELEIVHQARQPPGDFVTSVHMAVLKALLA